MYTALRIARCISHVRQRFYNIIIRLQINIIGNIILWKQQYDCEIIERWRHVCVHIYTLYEIIIIMLLDNIVLRSRREQEVPSAWPYNFFSQSSCGLREILFRCKFLILLLNACTVWCNIIFNTIVWSRKNKRHFND